ncbi:YqeG family HAD IIIA-type phosphatase [Secundilactobacillus collinoides]|uniref:Hydrolase n=1 Tax=Secundilactobacillus collinoides DSM 20515 = JCM 1123 TaxID=1423733 RepID=A0A0R2BFC5_SECCO|nr:YqeG family HAD IIIA-type phosphatase [Secundilactobacillus collinoides]KRM74355.1 hydrolase [Secundilactobacillus collinoides DSM 20515 = JCM 1123]
MISGFTPTWMIRATYDISPETLIQLGIKVVLTDLDNTLIAWNNPYGTSELKNWMLELERVGIQLVVVSNNSHQRVKKAVAPLGLPFVSRALKPLPFGIKRAMRQYHVTADQTVMVGDQLLTDVAAANASRVRSILVKPIVASDAWNTKINRFFEHFVMHSVKKAHPELTYRKEITINGRHN